ncbi:MAG: YkgJ family cysteine cluster protein [Halanaeroarchaeum sp.]
MQDLEADLRAAREIDVEAVADAIEAIGFECTRCGECCTADGGDPHTATVFPDEIRSIRKATDRAWEDVARPMPFGLSDGTGETFEWALQTDECGDCVFYEERDKRGACGVYDDRPLLCRTYPFSLEVGAEPAVPGAVEERAGPLRVHECEGVGREIEREPAEDLAETLKRRTIVELEEAIGVRDRYEPVESDGIVVHDSEGAKRPDGAPVTDECGDNY